MAQRYNTGNQRPSNSMKDLNDNALAYDDFLNGDADEVIDRLGKSIPTIRKTIRDANDKFHSQITLQDTLFLNSQIDKENRFTSFLDSSGYVFLGDYQNGPFQFSARNQYIRYNNQHYRLNTATDVGFTTTGTDAASFANDVTHFVLMDGDTLRQNLDSGEEGMGGDLVTPKKGRAPEAANLTRTVSNLLLDGVAGLRKNFGAVGDGYHDDTAAFNDWWECLMDIAYKRRAYEGDEAAIKFMLQKGPLLTIENGIFIYDGPGLNIGNSDVFVFNVKGESALSTKILLPNDGVYLFDFDNNPVHSRLSDMTIHGGLGAARYKSKARNASSTHDFERLRLSRYNECGISNNSVDMPYFRVNKCVFYGATDKQTIGVCVSGYSAGGSITESIFSDNRYGIKLSVGDNGAERNGPATPYLIDNNDFYRTGNRGAVDEDTGEFVRFASYDIWAEPGATAQNSGKGIKFTRNKFGQENLISPDTHILVADAYTTGTGAGLNGDRHHNEVISTGFFSGARFDGNDVNSTNGSYVAPFLRTFTPNTGNLHFSDSYDNGMPSRIIEFAGGITQSQIGSLARSNVFDISHCVALQKGVEPKLISNLNDVFRLIDPLLYYVGHPQSTIVPVGSQQVGFELLYSGPTSGIGLSNATRTSLNNSYGGIFEAAEITMTTSQGRATATVSGGVAGRKHWIDFDVRRSASNPVGSVVMEVMDSTGVTVIFRRIILLDTVARWQKSFCRIFPTRVEILSSASAQICTSQVQPRILSLAISMFTETKRQ